MKKTQEKKSGWGGARANTGGARERSGPKARPDSSTNKPMLTQRVERETIEALDRILEHRRNLAALNGATPAEIARITKGRILDQLITAEFFLKVTPSETPDNK